MPTPMSDHSSPAMTAANPRDLIATLERLRALLSAAQGVTTEALELATKLPLPPRREFLVCPIPGCGIQKRTEQALDDHVANVHGCVTVRGVSNPQPRAAS